MSDTTRSTSSRHPVEVQIRRYPGVDQCDVVVASRSRQLVVTCPDYERALRWAQMECKSYRIAPVFADMPPGLHVV